MENPWEAKYASLKRHCNAVEKHNLRLMNRIYHVKRMTKRAQKERKAIMDGLDLHNDNFRSFDLFFDADVLKESTPLKALKQFKVDNEKSARKPSSANKANERAEESNSASVVPYKSMNAYLVFCQFARKEILQIKPDISQIELTKLLAERWTHLKPEEKQGYYDTYEQNKNSFKMEPTDQVIQEFRLERPHHERRMVNPVQGNMSTSPGLSSFGDNSSLPTNISLAEIPSPTLADVNNPYGISNIPSPSFH